MILTGPAIEAAIAAGEIAFTPFVAAAVNPNSIDLRLGDCLRRIGPDGPNPDGSPAEIIHLDADGVFLQPGQLYLIDSLERFGSALYAPMVHGKSNIARAGLFVHANGEMVDRGMIAPYEFQLAPVLPIKVYAGMAIAQVTFWSVADD
jgi:dCTP deaminase